MLREAPDRHRPLLSGERSRPGPPSACRYTPTCSQLRARRAPSLTAPVGAGGSPSGASVAATPGADTATIPVPGDRTSRTPTGWNREGNGPSLRICVQRRRIELHEDRSPLPARVDAHAGRCSSGTNRLFPPGRSRSGLPSRPTRLSGGAPGGTVRGRSPDGVGLPVRAPEPARGFRAVPDAATTP